MVSDGRVARVGVPVVAVALALVLGTALTTVGVRRLGGEAAPAAPAVAAPVSADVRAALEERLRIPPGTSDRLPDDENGLGPLDARACWRCRATPSRTGRRRPEAGAVGLRAGPGPGLDGGGAVYVLLVSRFATAAGADGWVSGLATRLPGPALETEAAPGVVAWTGRSERFLEQHASFARGRYVYELTYLTPQEDPAYRRFERLLRRQAAHAARLDP